MALIINLHKVSKDAFWVSGLVFVNTSYQKLNIFSDYILFRGFGVYRNIFPALAKEP